MSDALLGLKSNGSWDSKVMAWSEDSGWMYIRKMSAYKMCIRWRWWSNLSNPDCDAMRNDKNAKHAIRAIRVIRVIRRRQVERKCIDNWQTQNFFWHFCLIFILQMRFLRAEGTEQRTLDLDLTHNPDVTDSEASDREGTSGFTSAFALKSLARLGTSPANSELHLNFHLPLPWKLMAVFFSSRLMAWPKFVQLFSWRFGRSKHSYQLLLDSETSCMTNSWQADFFPKQQLFDVLIDVWCFWVA